MTRAIPPAPSAHRLLKFVYLELRVINRSLRWLADESGVSYNTVQQAMQAKTNISLASAEAILNALGYTMKPTPLENFHDREQKRQGHPSRSKATSGTQKVP